MKRVQLQGTDLTVSNICYGTGNFKQRLSKQEAFDMLDRYVDAGGNFIDTANVYCRWLPDTLNCAEQYLGEWFRRGGNRDQICLATKGGHPDLKTGQCRVTKEALSSELDESLLTMGVDYVDFYWFHRDNAAMPIEEVIGLGEDFVAQGKVRYYGASNFTLPRMRQAVQWASTHPGRGFRALSNQWSLAYPNPGYKLDGDQTLEGVDSAYYCYLQQIGLPLIPYSATAGGYFNKAASGTLTPTLETGYDNPRNRALSPLVERMAKAYGVAPVCISLAILLAQSFQVIPVIAVSNGGQLAELLRASELTLSPEDVALLNEYL